MIARAWRWLTRRAPARLPDAYTGQDVLRQLTPPPGDIDQLMAGDVPVYRPGDLRRPVRDIY